MPTRKQLSLLVSTALVGLSASVTGLTAGDYEELSNAMYGGGLIAGLAAALAAVGAFADRRDRLARSQCRVSHLEHVLRKLKDEQDLEFWERKATDELAEARSDLDVLIASGDCHRAAQLRDAIDALEAAAGTRKAS